MTVPHRYRADDPYSVPLPSEHGTPTLRTMVATARRRLATSIQTSIENFSIKKFLLTCAIGPPMAIVYLTIIADGWRIAFEGMAKKIYKTDLAVLLGISQYEFAHRLDMATFCALVLMVLIWLAGTTAVRLVLCARSYKKDIVNHGLYRCFMVTIALGLFVFDSYLFYNAVSETSWGGGGGYKAVVATLGWALALLAVSVFHETLGMENAQ
jgi:hypothetical protein